MKNMNRYLALVALIISLISCQSEDVFTLAGD